MGFPIFPFPPQMTPKPQTGKAETCDYCDSADVEWIKCKLICRNCRRIVKSCADL